MRFLASLLRLDPGIVVPDNIKVVTVYSLSSYFCSEMSMVIEEIVRAPPEQLIGEMRWNIRC